MNGHYARTPEPWGGTTGCLRHVTFATKRDFAGTLTYSEAVVR
jgi:hypothetical protein